MTNTDKAALSDRLSGIGLVTPTLAEGQNELVETGRDIPELVEYIGQQLRVGGEATINAGMGLIEAKRKLQHGEWGTWLAEHFGLSARQAQRLMVIARNYGTNPTLASHLGQTKALALLALPESEREEFLSETHQVNGEEKTVIDMTSRELERAIRERDEARKAAEQAKADAKYANMSRISMEKSLKEANRLLGRSREDQEAAASKAMDLEKQLAELKAAPVEVAIAEVDQEALDRARAEGEAQAEKEFKKARSEAQRQVSEANASAAALKTELQQKQRELDNLQFELNRAQSSAPSPIALDAELAQFNLLFDQAQRAINQMHGLLLKIQGREDPSVAENLRRAMFALIDKAKEAAR